MMTSSRVLAILIAVAFIVLGTADPACAGAGDKRKRVKQSHGAYHTSWVYRPSVYNYCRVGWWQTLRYGKVRPRWAAFCRRAW